MLVKAIRAWNRYKYRLVPWVAHNINENSPRVIVPHMLTEETLSKQQISETLTSLCGNFTVGDKMRPFVSAKEDYINNMKVCHDHLGFTIETETSNLEDGGTGAFVSTGSIKKGSLVAIYPGTVYQPWEPVFFISVANSYLFRCADGVHIDGSRDSLSKSIYTSASRRDKHFGEYMCDTGWLDGFPLNPLNIGQYVNNQNKENPANVAYQEYSIPADFRWEYRRFIPNVEARTRTDHSLEAYDSNRLLKTVVLVALRDIDAGEELYSSYYTIVCDGDGEGEEHEATQEQQELEGPPQELEGSARVTPKVTPQVTQDEKQLLEEQQKILQKKPGMAGRKKMRT